jgi:predicted TIM-barrel fold metal-dependent hydrolase
MEKRRIIDSHLHLYDNKANSYSFLDQVDPMFEALIGDYSALPRKYLLNDYLADQRDSEVVGIVWNEFLAADPIEEVRWAQRLADESPIPFAIVGLVDFLSPNLQSTLEAYAACPNFSGVREHLAWDEDRPMRRFANRSDLLRDPQWKRGVKVLNRYRFTCQLEVFSTQLPDLLPVIQENAQIPFTIAVMAWPSQINRDGFTNWRSCLAEFRNCDNVRVSISALECIFGMNWAIAEARPWVETVFDLFGTDRIMFGSHRPISRLGTSIRSPYLAYGELASAVSPSEQDAIFRANAARWFFERLPRATR